MAVFRDAGAPVDSYAVGSYISGTAPIDFTGDIKEIDGRPIAKRGRIPGITGSPRFKPVDLAADRERLRRGPPVGVFAGEIDTGDGNGRRSPAQAAFATGSTRGR